MWSLCAHAFVQRYKWAVLASVAAPFWQGERRPESLSLVHLPGSPPPPPADRISGDFSGLARLGPGRRIGQKEPRLLCLCSSLATHEVFDVCVDFTFLYIFHPMSGSPPFISEVAMELRPLAP